MAGYLSEENAEEQLEQIFTGIEFVLDPALPEETRREARRVLIARGATAAETWLDANLVITETLDLKEGSRLASDTAMATTVWLAHSVKHRKRMNPKYYSPDPSKFMSGVIAVSNGDLPRNDVEALSGAMYAYGGQWKHAFTTDVTHVFALAPQGDVYEAAMRLKQTLDLEVVVPTWFQDCQHLQQKIPTGPYSFPSPAIFKPLAALASTPQGELIDRLKVIVESTEKNSLYRTVLEACGEKRSKSTRQKTNNIWSGKQVLLADDLGVSEDVRITVEDSIKRNGGHVVVGEGNIDVVDVLVCRFRSGLAFDEAVRRNITIGSLAWALYVEQVERLTSPLDQLQHFPIPNYAIKGFEHHNITITNYTGDSREYMKQLISLTGAEFTASFSQKNTLVIAATLVGTKVEKAITWGIPVVNHVWLEDCFLEWKALAIGGSASVKKYNIFPPGLNFMHLLGERGYMGFSETDPRRVGVELPTSPSSRNSGHGGGAAQSSSTNARSANNPPALSPNRPRKLGGLDASNDVHNHVIPRTSQNGSLDHMRTEPAVISVREGAPRYDIKEDQQPTVVVHNSAQQGSSASPRRDPTIYTTEEDVPLLPQGRRSEMGGQRTVSFSNQRTAPDGLIGEERAAASSRPTVKRKQSSTPTDLEDEVDLEDSRASLDVVASKPHHTPRLPGSSSIRSTKSLPMASPRSPQASSASRSAGLSVHRSHVGPMASRELVVEIDSLPRPRKGLGALSSPKSIRRTASDASPTSKSIVKPTSNKSSPLKKKVSIVDSWSSSPDDFEAPLKLASKIRKPARREPSHSDLTSEEDVSDGSTSSDSGRKTKRSTGTKSSRTAQEVRTSMPSSSKTIEAPVGRQRRGAATAAEEKLRDTIMPDLVLYQRDMKAGRGDPKRLRMDHENASSNSKKRPRNESSTMESDGEERGSIRRRKSDGGAARVVPSPRSYKTSVKGKARADDEDEDEEEENDDVSSRGEEASKPAPAVKSKAPKKVRMASPISQPSSEAGLSKTKKPKILTSQLKKELSDKQLKGLRSLGALIVENDPAQCTHLVMDGVKRSVKFLIALALGKVIVTPQWIQKCLDAKKFVEEVPFLLQDPEGEKKHNFKLVDAVRSVRGGKKIFVGHTFHISPKVKLVYSDMQRIIEANGGKAENDIKKGTGSITHRSNMANPKHHVVSCVEDRTLWASLQQRQLHLPIYTQELILQSALSQNVDWEGHRVDGSMPNRTPMEESD
ncbi:hypothetical protein FRB96_005405 [Tulasnella sp. 330]|nr:hypothetical protein FRB96_005405 [Tulasnella sp. 330]KAG8883005.1 hypothetical protein FRB97_007378 [Tulasnella sp. 331]KAG8888501.1 hypothetical protein FRB98_007541 [Tulasnella sp. 332]